jgi:rhodanese-related sulfurtransferase
MSKGYGYQANFKEVTPTQAKAILDQGNAVMIDVREPYEYEQVHAVGVTLIPLATLGEHLDEVPQDREVLVICHSGGRSAVACDMLVKAGYDKDKVYNVQGGTSEWQYENLPVERGK